MPKPAIHQGKADHNEQFFDLLKCVISSHADGAEKAVEGAAAALSEMQSCGDENQLGVLCSTAMAHLDVARAAIRKLGALPDDFLDWVIVGIFYCALHHVDAYLARKHNIHPTSHGSKRFKRTRNWYVAHYMKQISTDYATLYSLSRDVRYNEPFPISPCDVQRLMNDNLAAIKKFTSI